MKEFFAKILARSRKHLGTETVNVYTVRNLYISALTDLIETVGIDEALKRIFAWGFSMGHEYMLSLMKDIEKLKPFEDSGMIAEIAWYMFAGHFPSGTETRWEVWDGYRVFIVRFWDENCPWCRGVRLPVKKPICVYPAGAYEGAYQTSQVVMYSTKKIETERFAMARELKCKATGDNMCEFWIIDLPYINDQVLAQLIEEAVKRYPQLFATIKPEYSKGLREKI